MKHFCVLVISESAWTLNTCCLFLQMFADLHHLHQFISLDQGGSVTGASWVGGTNATDANIYFGKLLRQSLQRMIVRDHILSANVVCAQVPSTSTRTMLLRTGSMTTRSLP